MLDVYLANSLLLVDRGVHLGLCEARFVTLVVAVLAVTVEVEDDVSVEALPVLGR